ncbi:MAG: arylsulfotransferase family protein [Gemmatimonadales bacterium]
MSGAVHLKYAGRRLGVAITLALSAACGGDLVTPTGPPPVITASSVAANPHNVLSAVVNVSVADADSVAVRHGPAGAPRDALTPAVLVTGGQASVPVLGLAASTSHAFEVVAYGGGHVIVGDPLALVTGPLPGNLPQFVALGPAPSPGYVAFARGEYGLVIDNAGRVVWYRHFPEGVGLNFQPQVTGRYTVRPPLWEGSTAAPWLELDALGNVIRTIGCAGGLVSRFHDVLARPDGSYWLMCDETRVINLAGSGGVDAAQVTGTVFQHVSAAGALLFEWSPFDHFELLDLPPSERSGQTVNWTHGNALDLDAEGHLLVSFRNLSEITRINTQTGQVLWRMGGTRNQFTVTGAPAPAFSRQHGVRAMPQGRLLLLDNFHDPAFSRAEWYTYNSTAKSVGLTGAFTSTPPTLAGLGGTAQALPGDRLLVTFGSGAKVEEYDASGAVVWRIESPGYIFRAHRFPSLYQPGAGAPR